MAYFTSRAHRLASACLFAGVLFYACGIAGAGPIKVLNPSFESPQMDGMKTTHDSGFSDWRVVEHHGYGCLLLHNNSPDGPDASDGRQFAAIVNRDGATGETTQMTQQVLPPGLSGVQADYTYTLTLDLRKATPSVNNNVFRVGLYANAEMTRPLAELTGMMLQTSSDAWTRNAVTFNSTSVEAGKPMYIGIEASRIGGSMMSRMFIDNVQLESRPNMSAGAADQEDAMSAGPQFEMQPLFESQRIPKLLMAADGSVLALGRSCAKLKRSEDAGQTWQEVTLPENCRGNAMLDENTGDVLILLPKASSLWRSSDHGKTWSHETVTILPNEQGYGTPGNVPADPECSESGLTLRYGEHKGRLLMPIRIQPPDGSNDQEYWPYNYNAAIYSDDGGKTWQVSGPVQGGTGEGTLAEFSDGSVYYNSRSHMSIDDRRQIARSYDGGHMWVDWRVDETLREVGEPFYFKYGSQPSYGCNAGLVVLPQETTEGHDVLIYSTPDNPGGERLNMTVWASFDRGQTWPVKRLVYPGPSAYSSLTADDKGNIYLLFEHGEEKLYERLMLVRFNLAWLCDGKDWKQFLSE